jgi:hypothetical protein
MIFGCLHGWKLIVQPAARGGRGWIQYSIFWQGSQGLLPDSGDFGRKFGAVFGNIYKNILTRLWNIVFFNLFKSRRIWYNKYGTMKYCALLPETAGSAPSGRRLKEKDG